MWQGLSVLDIVAIVPCIPLIIVLVIQFFNRQILLRFAPDTAMTRFNHDSQVNPAIVAFLVVTLILVFNAQYALHEIKETIIDHSAPDLASHYRTMKSCVERFRELDCDGRHGQLQFTNIRGNICRMYLDCLKMPITTLELAVYWKYVKNLSCTWDFAGHIVGNLILVLTWCYSLQSTLNGFWIPAPESTQEVGEASSVETGTHRDSETNGTIHNPKVRPVQRSPEEPVRQSIEVNESSVGYSSDDQDVVDSSPSRPQSNSRNQTRTSPVKPLYHPRTYGLTASGERIKRAG